VLLVLGVSIGIAAIQAAVYLVGELTSRRALADTQAVLNSSQAPDRPNLDLALQLVSILAGVLPALLALHLLARDGMLPRLGLARTDPPLADPPQTSPARAGGAQGEVPREDVSRDLRRDIGRDLRQGALLAAVIGVPGLLLYLGSHALGLSAQVVPESLPAVWWRVPVLVASAAQNALLEEVIVVGYLLTRLETLGWRPGRALAASAVLRGGYHLYQGLSGFAGNLVMGLIFGAVFQRTRRVLPLIIAHTLLDAVAFVGYVLLHGHVSWLP
jgi:membrane protease YdiL (CAAX protease family)